LTTYINGIASGVISSDIIKVPTTGKTNVVSANDMLPLPAVIPVPEEKSTLDIGNPSNVALHI
jgi:hypothetical protein